MPTPRTVTAGDVALYTGLYGPRFAVQSSGRLRPVAGLSAQPARRSPRLPRRLRQDRPRHLPERARQSRLCGGWVPPPGLYPGETLSTVSEVIGLKESSNRQTGVVYVRSVGSDEHGETTVLSYCRWVLVRQARSRGRGHGGARAHLARRSIPRISPARCRLSRPGPMIPPLAGSPHRFADYAAGERIDHVDGMTVEEAEHQISTRLFQNTAKVHFDGLAAKDNRFGRRLIYGGHVISLARALSYNGLANAFAIAGINAGRHVGPLFAAIRSMPGAR